MGQWKQLPPALIGFAALGLASCTGDISSATNTPDARPINHPSAVASGVSVPNNVPTGVEPQVASPPDSAVKQTFIGTRIALPTSSEDVNTVSAIRRGTIMESTGEGRIPAGTVVYPIEVEFNGGGDLRTKRFAFFQDPFGKWDYEPMY